MIFLYFPAYLTGIGALLERLNPPDVATTPLITDGFNNATNFDEYELATNVTIETADVVIPGEVSSVAIEAVYWVLLVFYALVPVVACAWCGGSQYFLSDAPDDPAKYAEWLEKESTGFKGPVITIIAPFEKNYSWCVPAWRISNLPWQQNAPPLGTKL